jgi:hypothetical protein
MKINTLPVEIQNRVFTLQLEAGNLPNGDSDLLLKKHEGNFNWHETDENYHFWAKIYCHEYSEFWDKYGHNYPDPRLKLQDKLKNTIADIIRDCPFTMSDNNWDSLRDLISIHLQKMLAK